MNGVFFPFSSRVHCFIERAAPTYISITPSPSPPIVGRVCLLAGRDVCVRGSVCERESVVVLFVVSRCAVYGRRRRCVGSLFVFFLPPKLFSKGESSASSLYIVFLKSYISFPLEIALGLLSATFVQYPFLRKPLENGAVHQNLRRRVHLASSQYCKTPFRVKHRPLHTDSFCFSNL